MYTKRYVEAMLNYDEPLFEKLMQIGVMKKDNPKQMALDTMILRMKSVKPLENYILQVKFDDGKECLYDVKEDIRTINSYEDLENIPGLFEQVQLDQSRTCIFWNDYIDLPSDIIYEYGKMI